LKLDLEKAAKRISSLKTFNPNHKWSLQDKLLHERVKKIHDQEASIAFRKNLLESQRRANYINEYDRLRGEMESGLVGKKHPLEKQLKTRQLELRELARLSLNLKFKGSSGFKHSELEQPQVIYR